MRYLVVVCFMIFQVHVVRSRWERGSYRCNTTELITYENFCDGKVHCSNELDEIPLESNENHFDPLAEMQRCNNPLNDVNISCAVSRDLICDEEVKCSNLTPCDYKCETHYKCLDGTCVRRATVCDKYPCDGCSEDHEWINGPGFKCVRGGTECILPQILLHDDIPDCDRGTDLCFKLDLPENATSRNEWQPMENLDKSKCFECMDGSMIIPKSRVCDGIIDCTDLSDECICVDESPSICKQVIKYGQHRIKTDTDGGDATTGNISADSSRTIGNYTDCDVGHVMCATGKCILRESVCDGIKDCGEDESYDICRGTIACKDAVKEEYCRCSPKQSCRHLYGTACDSKADCPFPRNEGYDILSFRNDVPEDECIATCTENPSNFTCGSGGEPELRHKLWGYSCDVPEGVVLPDAYDNFVDGDKFCDGIIDCELLGDDEDEYCETDQGRYLCDAIRPGYVSIRKDQKCDGNIDCKDWIDESIETCGNTRFSCAVQGGRKVNVDLSAVCDFSITCDDAEDERNCTDDRYYCESGEPLFIRGKQKFDSRGDCSDWSDECPTKTKPPFENAFSSRYELIANPILRTLVWAMGLFAIIGNAAVILRESLKLRKLSDLTSAMIANRFLILNLAVSDLVMGIYLIALGSVTVQMQGVYCSKDLIWRSSVTCASLGVLSVIASETSVMTMVFLTSCRLYAVFRPFKSSSRPQKRTVFLMIAISWMTSLLLALLPFTSSLSNIFVTHVVMDNPYFQNAVVSLDGVRELFRTSLTYDLRPNVTLPGNLESFVNGATWAELQEAFPRYFLHQKLEIIDYMGYYSIDSVCIPKFFISRSDPAWIFSLLINIFNFLAFTFVASSYVGIYVKSRKANVAAKRYESEESQMRAMQRKVIRLIATDFCCWIPITIMAFLNVSGVEISNTAYAVSAIVLLPINSALNPLLYSDMFDSLYKKLFPPKPRSRTPSQQTTHSHRSDQSSNHENDAKNNGDMTQGIQVSEINVRDTQL